MRTGQQLDEAKDKFVEGEARMMERIFFSNWHGLRWKVLNSQTLRV
jgi:hypothetical protein